MILYGTGFTGLIPSGNASESMISRINAASQFEEERRFLQLGAKEDSPRVPCSDDGFCHEKSHSIILNWIFETKLDGYRAITVIDSAGKARIWSRNRLPLERKFPTIRDAVEGLNLRSSAALLDPGDRNVFTAPDYPEWRNQHN